MGRIPSPEGRKYQIQHCWGIHHEICRLALTHVAISLSPSSLSTVPLEVEEPTDDCELSWAVYDVINAIRGTVH